jgi:hypothetical protein
MELLHEQLKPAYSHPLPTCGPDVEAANSLLLCSRARTIYTSFFAFSIARKERDIEISLEAIVDGQNTICLR